MRFPVVLGVAFGPPATDMQSGAIAGAKPAHAADPVTMATYSNVAPPPAHHTIAGGLLCGLGPVGDWFGYDDPIRRRAERLHNGTGQV